MKLHGVARNTGSGRYPVAIDRLSLLDDVVVQGAANRLAEPGDPADLLVELLSVIRGPVVCWSHRPPP
jgi:hypothetical protein